MKFIILTYETANDFAARTAPDRQAQYWAGWAAFGSALKAADIVSEMHGLQAPGTASTVRARTTGKQVEPGPFVAGDSQLGGYFIIDVESAEAATEWAARCPAAVNGAVEVRPLL